MVRVPALIVPRRRNTCVCVCVQSRTLNVGNQDAQIRDSTGTSSITGHDQATIPPPLFISSTHSHSQLLVPRAGRQTSSPHLPLSVTGNLWYSSYIAA